MTSETKRPLNGTRTHPLTPHATSELRSLRGGGRPRQEINPGVIDRLSREGLIETYDASSPYRTRKGDVRFVRLTSAGTERIAATDAIAKSTREGI